MRITSTAAALLLALGMISGLSHSSATPPPKSIAAAISRPDTMVWDTASLL
jgi:hypothetical protein